MQHNKPFHIVFFILLLMMALFGCKNNAPLETVAQVDLKKYAGRWYEISTIPIRPQRGCSCTYAEYTETGKGYIKVYNHCIKNGKVSDITGKAFIKDSTNARLSVQFFWPFKGDYRIIALGDNYEWALVGSGNRKNLWVLCKEPQMEETTYVNILKIAVAKGFDTTKLIKTPQNCK